MFTVKPWMKIAHSGEVYTGERASVDFEEHDGVTAVFIRAHSRTLLDPDNGAGLDIPSLGEIRGYMADYRYCEFWCRPAFGTDITTVPDETQALVYEKVDGTFGVILPVVSEKYKCVLQGTENGLTARLFSWYDERRCCALAFLTAEGNNPYELMEKCVTVGLKLLNNGCAPRKQRRYPEVFDYLGWCSWDSMQIRVSEEGLLQKCEEFKQKDIPVRWAILDDMWAEVHDFYDETYSSRSEMFNVMHSSTLYSFEADPRRFPHGLKHCLDIMKEKYGMIIGMWHPTTGYWRGIDTEGPIFEKLKDDLYHTSSGEWIHHYELNKAFKFYNEFHSFLKKAGADFVKVDNQTMIRCFYKGVAPLGQIARDVHTAIEASVGAHFDNQLINCMGMGSEDIWNRPISAISRCSNDFQPENREWFTKHILQCAYNSLMQGQFLWCDWDMWWTDDGQAVKNSVIRAISGGPIYVSDELDRSNRDILMPLVLADGRILRCDNPGTPTRDCLIVDPQTSGKPFKLQNTAKGSGILTVFNLSTDNTPVTGTISPADVEGLEGEEFVVYEHFSGLWQYMKKDEVLEITLASADDFLLYNIVPMQDGFAPIGLIEKFIAPATISARIGQAVELADHGTYAYVKDGQLYKETV